MCFNRLCIIMFLYLCSILFYGKSPKIKQSNSDLYRLVGVSSDSSVSEVLENYEHFIKLSNRTMSNARTMDLFDEISDAYDVLLVPTSRNLYDKYGFEIINRTSFSIYGYQDEMKLNKLKHKIKEISDDGFGGIITFPLQFELKDFFIGGKKVIKSLRTVKCQCPRGGSKCSKCRRNAFLQETITEIVELPKGAPEMFRIMVNDLGDGKDCRGASNVIFIAFSKKDKIFERKGSNLFANHNVNFVDILKDNISFTNIDGEKINVPVNIKHINDEIRIIGKGFPYYNSKKRGDLFIRLNAIFPKELTNDIIEHAFSK